jgi:hypothetical protein
MFLKINFIVNVRIVFHLHVNQTTPISILIINTFVILGEITWIRLQTNFTHVPFKKNLNTKETEDWIFNNSWCINRMNEWATKANKTKKPATTKFVNKLCVASRERFEWNSLAMWSSGIRCQGTQRLNESFKRTLKSSPHHTWNPASYVWKTQPVIFYFIIFSFIRDNTKQSGVLIYTQLSGKEA